VSAVISKAQAFLDAQAALMQAATALGVTLSPAGALLLLGQGWGESFFGRAVAGYDPSMRGTNNVGSIDSTPGWLANHQAPGFGKFAHLDTMDGHYSTGYVAWFRIYPNQLEAWKGSIQFVTYGNPAGLAAALAGGAAAYAHWLKIHGYYGVSEAAYAAMLAGAATTAKNALSAAAAQNLTPADPASAGQNENEIAPLSERFSKRPDLIAGITPATGVVWTVSPPSSPAGGNGSGAAGAGGLLLALAFMVTLAWAASGAPMTLRGVRRAIA
jgi:hypothetical protein